MRPRTHADRAQMHAENFYTADELWCVLFVLPNWTRTWQRYEVVQNQSFLACIPQGNAGCQGKSINSHAKMIRSIVLVCCAQVGKFPIYSYCLVFSSLALLTCKVRDMEVIQEKLHMLTYSKSGLFLSGMTHHYCLILWYWVAVTTLLICTLKKNGLFVTC